MKHLIVAALVWTLPISVAAEPLLGTWQCELAADDQSDYAALDATMSYQKGGQSHGEAEIRFELPDQTVDLSMTYNGIWHREDDRLTERLTGIKLRHLYADSVNLMGTAIADDLIRSMLDASSEPAIVTFVNDDTLYQDDDGVRIKCERLGRKISS